MKEKLTNDILAGIIENDGLTFAALNSVHTRDFKDRDIAMLWERAEKALLELKRRLDEDGYKKQDHGGPDYVHPDSFGGSDYYG